jgi:hypothetical protein
VVLVGLAVTALPVVALNPVPGLHVYVLAPLAVKDVDEPEQIVCEATVKVGVGLTVIVAVAVLVHPEADVPVTVYAVVTVGLAVTALPVVALNPVEGLHVYVLAPLAVNEVDEPLQIV